MYTVWHYIVHNTCNTPYMKVVSDDLWKFQNSNLPQILLCSEYQNVCFWGELVMCIKFHNDIFRVNRFNSITKFCKFLLALGERIESWNKRPNGPHRSPEQHWLYMGVQRIVCHVVPRYINQKWIIEFYTYFCTCLICDIFTFMEYQKEILSKIFN